MEPLKFLAYLLVMAGVTYLVRMLPMVIVRRKIASAIRSSSPVIAVLPAESSSSWWERILVSDGRKNQKADHSLL